MNIYSSSTVVFFNCMHFNDFFNLRAELYFLKNEIFNMIKQQITTILTFFYSHSFCYLQERPVQSSSLQSMAPYPLFHVDLISDPRHRSLVTKDTDLLGHVCGHVTQMGNGQATNPSAKVSKKRTITKNAWC